MLPNVFFFCVACSASVFSCTSLSETDSVSSFQFAIEDNMITVYTYFSLFWVRIGELIIRGETKVRHF